MRVLVLFAHPVETSFQAALHRTVVTALTQTGHQVDDCDLYAEGFEPVMSRAERIDYHNTGLCRKPVEGYVRRVLEAECLVVIFPVWNYGYPAILKGFFDRVFLPGVSFELVEGKLRPTLHGIRKLGAVVTYGGARWRTVVMGDPPRRIVKRSLKAMVHPRAQTKYLALYDLNRADETARRRFTERVDRQFRNF